MLTRTYFVYIMTNKKHGTLYTGVTNDLVKRVYQHREGQVEGFTRKHGLKHLVWYEPFDDIEQAIVREKRIKRWRRAWKIQLIEKQNPIGMICGERLIYNLPVSSRKNVSFIRDP